jgi:probable rRNA maturation factor
MRQPAIHLQVQTPAWKTALPGYRALAAKVARLALKMAEGGPPGPVALSIVLADDAMLQDLNATWRGKDKPTNVLSFPLWDADQIDALPAGEALMLGDIFLSFETLEQESAAQKKPLADHFAHLVAHGTLHLLGYDHIEDADAAAMERLEIAILNKLSIQNPYA